MKIVGMDATSTNITFDFPASKSAGDSLPNAQKSDTANDKDPNIQNTPDKIDYPEKIAREAAERLNRMLEGLNRRISVSVHEKTHEIMVKVVDNITGEVVREIPPKKILDMVANMMEMAGLLVDERR